MTKRKQRRQPDERDIVHVVWVDSVVGGGEWQGPEVVDGGDAFCESVGFYFDHGESIALVQTIGNTGDGEDAVLNWVVIPKRCVYKLDIMKKNTDEQEGLANRSNHATETPTVERKSDTE